MPDLFLRMKHEQAVAQKLAKLKVQSKICKEPTEGAFDFLDQLLNQKF